MAAYGELSLRSCFTTMPPDVLASVSAPVRSVTVMMVLLNDEKMCAIAHLNCGWSAMIYPSFGVSAVVASAGASAVVGAGVAAPSLGGAFGADFGAGTAVAGFVISFSLVIGEPT